MTNRNIAEQTAETYYDSHDADTFYERIWGGEDIHIGLYGDDMSIAEASHQAVLAMSKSIIKIDASSKVLDLGSGYGGAARVLAETYGCQVTCLNLSAIQNKRNRQINQEQGLDQLISVVHGSFEAIPGAAESYDVIWSQDAFLHSSNKALVLREAARVLKPGGELIFTDPMQANDCTAYVLQPVYDRLKLDSLASPEYYRNELKALGFQEILFRPLTHHLRHHYFKVAEGLKSSYQDLLSDVSKGYLDQMIIGLDNWVAAADSGYLAWGVLHFKKSLQA